MSPVVEVRVVVHIVWTFTVAGTTLFCAAAETTSLPPLEKMAVCPHMLQSHFGVRHFGLQTQLQMLMFADQSAGWQDAVPRARRDSPHGGSRLHWPDLHDLQLHDLKPNPHWLASLRRHDHPLGRRPGTRPRQPEVP